MGLDYRPNLIRSDANMILSVSAHLPKLRTKSRMSIFDEPYMAEQHTLNCLTSTGAATAGTCALKYALSFSPSMFARTSPYSPPIFFEDDMLVVLDA